MKLAIHHREGSFSDDWIKHCEQSSIPYKLVNAYSNDIIAQVEDCDIVLWHHQQSDYRDLIFAKELLFSLRQAGKLVYPDFETGWHFDDKVGQKYLLEAISAPMVRSYVFYTKEEALSWAQKVSYPVVFKLRGGAGGSNVKLVQNFKQNKKIIRKSFSSGHSGFDPIIRLKDNFKLYKKGQIGINLVLKSFLRIFVPNRNIRFIKKEVGYVYYQEFLPNNDCDIRLIVIGGNKAYGMKRLVREGDFRASGSKNFVYDKIEDEVLKIAFDVAKKLKLQSVAFDFIYDQNHLPKIVEISYGFGTSGSSKCTGYWDELLTWHEGEFHPINWIIDDLKKELE